MAILTVIHIIVALLLIVLVLLQDSKGAMGSTFGGGGGGGDSLLGPTGTPNFLFKLTRYTVIIFAATSLFLSKYASEKPKSALDQVNELPKVEKVESKVEAPTENPEKTE